MSLDVTYHVVCQIIRLACCALIQYSDRQEVICDIWVVGAMLLYCAYKAMFLIFEGRRNSPGARCLLCTVYTVLTPYGLVSMGLVRVQRSLTCGRCPIHVLGPVWSGTQGGGIEPVPAASRAPQPAPLQLPVGHRCPSKDHYLRNFF